MENNDGIALKEHQKEIVPKVLIVDDRPENILAMKKVLESLPIEIHQSHSGEEALSLILDYEFAVVLLDVQMPGLDGFEIAALMHANEDTCHIPIIFVTAINTSQSHVKKGHDSGAVDYIFKPYDPEILRSKVRVFVRLYCREKSADNLLKELQETQIKLEKSNQELKYLANFDLLTKLPNRLHFEETIKQVLSSSKRHGHIFALLFTDLDNFKTVNDSYGHHVGDVLISTVANKLKTCFRESDFISHFGRESFLSRLGGDEFAIILSDLRNVHDAGVAAKRAIETVSGPCRIAGNDIQVSMSIGIACYPESGQSVSLLYQNADSAMYHAKAVGKNTYQYYTESLNSKHKTHIAIESALGFAIDRQELSLVYQPIYRLKGKVLLGMEVLLRWNSKELGVVAPSDFIPIAEDSGLIFPISQWVLDNAFKQWLLWKKSGYSSYELAINISGKLLLKDSFFDFLSDLIKTTKVDPKSICLELTETILSDQDCLDKEVLQEFKKMGFSLSIDDFGTGASSLLRLKEVPFDTLKIDRSFVQKVNSNKKNAVMSRLMIQLSKNLGLSTIAEGIETKKELDYLIKEGCEQGQGYYLSKPLSVKDMSQHLKEQLKKSHKKNT